MHFFLKMYDIIVVGCGLSGCVIAERFANVLNKKVLIIDKRDHIGGNCYDFIDEDTNIRVSKYGPHFFHTNYEDVWEYINKFEEWERYDHKVVSVVENKLVPVPVNITTVNMLCQQNIKNENEMNQWLSNNQVKYDEIKNGKQMACSLVGEQLYEKLFKNYTYKQWDKYPDELLPETLARIPVRNNFDDRYFTDKYQVLPKNGYTTFIKNMINNENITIKLDTDFFKLDKDFLKDKIVIYTGPIDHYFSKIGYEKLEYRSLNIIFEKYYNMNYFQTHTSFNYPEMNLSFTRITEYKHCLNQKSPHTIISKEYSCSDGEPYYPVLNDRNVKLYEKYKKLAEDETINGNIHFIGRLANFKYFNMDQAIKNSLDYFNDHFYQ